MLAMENIKVVDTKTQIEVNNACIDGSSFINVSLANVVFNDVNLSHIKISNANMSDIEIENARLGGAYIHDIGVPPVGHPMHDPNVVMRPVKFEDCYLAGSVITNCNLADVIIDDCNVAGMMINGIALDDLLKAYNKQA